jgi:hypothetical protein
MTYKLTKSWEVACSPPVRPSIVRGDARLPPRWSHFMDLVSKRNFSTLFPFVLCAIPKRQIKQIGIRGKEAT